MDSAREGWDSPSGRRADCRAEGQASGRAGGEGEGRRKWRWAGVVTLGLALVVAAVAVCGSDSTRGGVVLVSERAQALANDWYENTMLSINHTIAGSTEYQSWSKKRVRAEAFAVKNRLTEIAKKEAANHFQALDDQKNVQTALENKIAAQEGEITGFTGKIQSLAQALGSALESLEFAASSLDGKEKAQEAHTRQALQEIRDVLSNHTALIDANRGMISSGYEAVNAHLHSMRKEITDILDSDGGEMRQNDKDLQKRISAMRSALDDDVAHLTEFANQVHTGLADSVNQEAKDVAGIGAKIEGANAVLDRHSSAIESIRGEQEKIRAQTQSNANVLSSVSGKVAEAEAKLGELSTRLDGDAQANSQAIADAKSTKKHIQAELAQRLQEIEAIEKRFKDLKAANKDAADQEKSDFAGLRASILALSQQITQAGSLKTDLADLKTMTKARLGAAQSTIDSLKQQSQQLDLAISGQTSDITGLLARLSVVEASDKGLRESSASNRAIVRKQIAALQAKLKGMLGLKADIDALSAQTAQDLRRISSEMDALKAQSSKAGGEDRKQLSDMKRDIAAHVAESQSGLASAGDKMTRMDKDVHELQNFQADTSTLQGKLVRELTDVTQSLGILDTKFSGQNVDVSGKIAKLESAVAGLPTKAEVDKGIAKAMDIGNKNAQDLGDLAGKVDTVKSAVDASRATVDGFGKVVQQHIDRAKEQVKGVRGTIKGEGKLFSEFAKKLDDAPLQRKVAEVFGK